MPHILISPCDKYNNTNKLSMRHIDVDNMNVITILKLFMHLTTCLSKFNTFGLQKP